MMYRMGHLVYSADVRASRVEAAVTGLIERAIVAALTPIRDELRDQRKLITTHGLAFDALTMRVETCEWERRQSGDVTTLKADVASSDVLVISEIPPENVTGDVALADDYEESDAPESDEK
uniref:Polyprotein protein n=1 Tax=Solanum tuberosum TaxID=4113 RepID=M1D961_SOLTU